MSANPGTAARDELLLLGSHRGGVTPEEVMEVAQWNGLALEEVFRMSGME